MDFLKVLAPTFWCNRLFGLSSYLVYSNGVRHSPLLQIHRYLFCVTTFCLQIGWFCYHIYLKYKIQAMEKFQEVFLLFCVGCNMTIALLPFRSLFSDSSTIHHLMYEIHRWEREIFLEKNGKKRKLFLLNIIILTTGFMVPVTFTAMETLKTWSSYMVGKQHVLVDVVGLSNAFVRSCTDVILLNNYVMCTLVYGTIYESINECLSTFVDCSVSTREKIDWNFLFKYLKELQVLDNVLKDFQAEIMRRLSVFCAIMVILVLCNWFYVVGFLFLNLSPLFVTYYAWVMFFTAILAFIICGSVYARHQMDRTPGLLHKSFIDCDDPRVIEEVEILSLQLAHRKVELQAGGVFKLDFSLLISILGTIITYVVILVQFEDHEMAGKHRFNQNNQTPFKNHSGF